VTYEKRISRAEPGLIVLVLDDSQSMTGALTGTSDPKFLWVERYAGVILKELLARSTETRGETVVVKPRYFVHLIIYGGTPNIWGNTDKALDIQAAVQKYAEAKSSLGLGGTLGGTDTAAALSLAYEFLDREIANYRTCFPPMVFHLTDGESPTDAEPISEKIRALSTDDGNTLLCNVYIGASTNASYSGPDDFEGYASEDDAGPSPYCTRLFRMSSEVPPAVRSNLIADGIFPKIRNGARLFFDVRTKDMLKHTIQVVGSQGSRGREVAAGNL
jgi:hypothetical protein